MFFRKKTGNAANSLQLQNDLLGRNASFDGPNFNSQNQAHKRANTAMKRVDSRIRDSSANRTMAIDKKNKKFTKEHDPLDDVSDMEDEEGLDPDFEDIFDNMIPQRGTQTDGFTIIGEQNSQFNLPEPLYPDVINIGDVSGKTKLQQICEQLGIKESEYIWYNSNQNIKVQIDPELYNESFELFDAPRENARAGTTVGGSVRVKAPSITMPSNLDSVMRAKHPRDELEHKGNQEDGEDVAQERLDRITNETLVQVMDLQKYMLMDFEFMQRKLDPPRTFVLQAYNKKKEAVVQNPQITIECKKHESYFLLTHLLEKYLPLKWQAFFEEALKIKAPDCYQFHCYLLKKNSYGMRQPRFFVISQVFMFNTECQFNPKTGKVEFQSLQWQVPIQAINKIVITEEKEKKIKMSLSMDGTIQNQILTHFGYKKVTKTERSVEFATKQKTTAREFLWHLKRIHHWWNCCSDGQQKKTALDIQVA